MNALDSAAGVERMRVAFVLSEFPSLSETFVLNQITGMVERGCDVHIYADHDCSAAVMHGPVAEYDLTSRTTYPLHVGAALRSADYHAIRRLIAGLGSGALRAIRSRGYGPHMAFAALRYGVSTGSASRDYDIIHCHFGPNGLKAAALRAAKVLSGELIVTFHGHDVSRFVLESGRGVYAPLIGEAVCLPVTARWRDRLIELGFPRDRVIVHRMGVDCSMLEYRERTPAPDEPIEIVTVARLVEKKGLEFALTAIAQVREKRHVRYTIVGDGPERSRLEALVEQLGLSRHVRITGWSRDADVRAALYRSHIALQPSVTAATGDEEGLPVALMEAMATGLPVVATRHSAIPELVTDGVEGFLVAERNPEELADRVLDLIEGEDIRRAMGVAARLRVERQHDIGMLNDRLVDIYRSALTDTRGAAA